MGNPRLLPPSKGQASVFNPLPYWILTPSLEFNCPAMLHLFLFAVLYWAAVSYAQAAMSATCYSPNGQVDPDSFPCRPDSLEKDLHSGCCSRDDTCYSDGSCGMISSNLPYIRSCTDKTWTSKACPLEIAAACPRSSTSFSFVGK